MPSKLVSLEPTAERSDEEPGQPLPSETRLAAMEPTGERSDEVNYNPTAGVNQWPQWSRPANGRMSVPDPRHLDVGVAAAMEPTGERSDELTFPSFAACS